MKKTALFVRAAPAVFVASVILSPCSLCAAEQPWWVGAEIPDEALMAVGTPPMPRIGPPRKMGGIDMQKRWAESRTRMQFLQVLGRRQAKLAALCGVKSIPESRRIEIETSNEGGVFRQTGGGRLPGRSLLEFYEGGPDVVCMIGASDPVGWTIEFLDKIAAHALKNDPDLSEKSARQTFLQKVAEVKKRETNAARIARLRYLGWEFTSCIGIGSSDEGSLSEKKKAAKSVAKERAKKALEGRLDLLLRSWRSTTRAIGIDRETQIEIGRELDDSTYLKRHARKAELKSFGYCKREDRVYYFVAPAALADWIAGAIDDLEARTLQAEGFPDDASSRDRFQQAMEAFREDAKEEALQLGKESTRIVKKVAKQMKAGASGPPG